MNSVEQWNTLMSKLPDYVDAEGLVTYFPGMRYGSEVLTAYLLSVSNEAKALGLDFSIPEVQRETMQQALLMFVQGKWSRQRWAPHNEQAARKVLVLEALAREGLVRAAWLDSIRIAPERWSTSSVIDWLSILQRVEDIPQRLERMQEAENILR